MISKSNNLSWLKYVFLISPFIVGFFGYLPTYDNHVLWAAYSAVRLYGFNVDTQHINIAIEIVRWVAPLATFGAFLMVLNAAKYIAWRIITLFKTGYVIYGSSKYAKALAANIGRQAYLVESKKPVKCKRHIIMFESDDETIEFYDAITQKNRHTQVYMQLSDIFRDSISSSEITVFNMEENCARLYWNEHPIVKPKEEIAIIGFPGLGQDILHFGLLHNVFDLSQNVTYHVFGDSKKYSSLHTELGNIEDTVKFYEQQWYEQYCVLKKCDRIILCGEESNNLAILGECLRSMAIPDVYIKISSKEQLLSLFFNSDSIHPFGMTEQLCTKEIVLNDELYNLAKAIHNSYASKYGLQAWEQLNTFKRYSNIAAADHISVKKRLLNNGLDIETLAEIEHMRWARYHYLNNWTYAEKRNDAERHHNCLIPYAELSEEEKQKDRDNYSGFNEQGAF